jgi:hypothetical protein
MDQLSLTTRKRKADFGLGPGLAPNLNRSEVRMLKTPDDLLAVVNPSDLQFYQVSRGFNSKRLQTSTKSLSLSDSKFEQVGHGFNSEIQQPLLIVTSTLPPFANRNVGINLASLFKMSGRGGRNNGRSGRGRGNANRGGRGQGWCQNYTGSANAAKRGLCTNLGTHVFEYGQKSEAEQMRNSREKLVQYVGTNYGQDINNELQNKAWVVLTEPVHTDDVLARHSVREVTIRNGQLNIQQARQAQENILKAAVQAGTDMDAPMRLTILQNEISQGEFAASIEVPVVLTDSDKTQFSNDWRTFRERNTNLVKHRGQAFSLIQGQCAQLLQDKIKQDTDWNTVSISYDSLTLYRLIERTVLAQTEDQYPCATLYDQKLSFYSFKQDNISNPQWYERFNTKFDVSGAIGLTRQYILLLEYVAQESYTRSFTDLGPVEQQLVRDDAEERYVPYAFLCQSGTQHGNLKVDLQNDFTTGDNRYPKNHQQTLHLLDKYSKNVVAKVTHSEGTSITQKGGRGGGNRSSSSNGKGRDSSTYHNKYWNYKECYKWHKKGHPAAHCPKKPSDDDDRSTASAASSVKKLKKYLKSIKKAFTTVNTQLAQLKEADSDISESEGEEASYFQVDQALQFAQLDKKFEPRIAKLFKQAGSSIKLDLKGVILLDSQSTMDHFCNAALIGKISKSRSNMWLKRNGGTMVVTRKATMEGYNKNGSAPEPSQTSLHFAIW